MDFILEMYSQDHPEELKFSRTSFTEVAEELCAWWDAVKNPETRKKMMYNGQKPVIPDVFRENTHRGPNGHRGPNSHRRA